MTAKTLRTAVAATASGAALLLPAVVLVSPQADAAAKCKYPSSIVTDTKLVYPTVIVRGTTHTARVNVDGTGGPNGRVEFRIGRHGSVQSAKVADGKPVRFKFGPGLKSGRTYVMRAKFFGSCKYRDSSDQGKVTVLKP